MGSSALDPLWLLLPCDGAGPPTFLRLPGAHSADDWQEREIGKSFTANWQRWFKQLICITTAHVTPWLEVGGATGVRSLNVGAGGTEGEGGLAGRRRRLCERAARATLRPTTARSPTSLNGGGSLLTGGLRWTQQRSLRRKSLKPAKQ